MRVSGQSADQITREKMHSKANTYFLIYTKLKISPTSRLEKGIQYFRRGLLLITSINLIQFLFFLIFYFNFILGVLVYKIVISGILYMKYSILSATVHFFPSNASVSPLPHLSP